MRSHGYDINEMAFISDYVVIKWLLINDWMEIKW